MTDHLDQGHSPEYLNQRLRKFYSLFGREVKAECRDACHAFFTAAGWNKADRRFMKALADLVHIELEVRQGAALSNRSKLQLEAEYSARFYRDYWLPRIKPTIRGHHETKKANAYNATAYVQSGFDAMAGLAAGESRQRCHQRVFEVMPYFYQSFLAFALPVVPAASNAVTQTQIDGARKMFPSAVGNVPFSSSKEEMFPSAIGNDPTIKIDSPAAPVGESVGASLASGLPESEAQSASPAELAKAPIYSCSFCRKRYKKAAAFGQHKCKEADRYREMQTPVGQRALAQFNRYQKLRKRSPISPKAFMTTRQYSSWIKFTKWAHELDLADVSFYMEVMIALKRSVENWTHTDSYEAYLRAYDETNPMDLVDASASRLKAWAETAEVPTGEVFDLFDFQALHGELQTRRLTAWLLMCSAKFKPVYAKLTPEQQGVITREIEKAVVRFKAHPNAIQYAKRKAVELGI